MASIFAAIRFRPRRPGRSRRGGFLIGRSVHQEQEAAAVAGADYLIAGTVFPTPSKPGLTEWLGVEGLARICRSVSVPVLAIGGVTPDRLPSLAAAGAAGIAGIGLFAAAGRPLADVLAEARSAWTAGRGLTA